VRKLIHGNDTQFADFAAIFIRKTFCAYGNFMLIEQRRGLVVMVSVIRTLRVRYPSWTTSLVTLDIKLRFLVPECPCQGKRKIPHSR
jgi:hypothetical protein